MRRTSKKNGFIFHTLIIVWTTLVASPAAQALDTCCECAIPNGQDQWQSANVGTVSDPWTIELDDKQKLTLINLYLPALPNIKGEVMANLLQKRHDWLVQTLPAGTKILFLKTTDKPDRYGRLKAQIKTPSNTLLAYELVREGLALYSAQTANFTCDPEFKTAERQARSNKKNIWSQDFVPYLKKPNSKNNGQWSFIENSWRTFKGKIVSIGVRKHRHYINFGNDWNSDFTIQITPEISMSIFGHEKALMSLKGKFVTVRGELINRGGPMIELTHKEQIEVY